RHVGLPDRLVVGPRARRQDGDAAVTARASPARARRQRRGMLSRRDVLVLGAGAFALGAPQIAVSVPSDEVERHGLSAFGDLKYAADFAHFDYVNPQAPKGGTFSQIGPSRQFNQNFLTFNSLNSYILKGDAAQ